MYIVLFCILFRAQVLLSSVLLAVPPDTLRKVPAIKQLVESILPYSERHFARLERLHKASFLLDYTVCLHLLLLFPIPLVVFTEYSLTRDVSIAATAASNENSCAKRCWSAVLDRCG